MLQTLTEIECASLMMILASAKTDMHLHWQTLSVYVFGLGRGDELTDAIRLADTSTLTSFEGLLLLLEETDRHLQDKKFADHLRRAVSDAVRTIVGECAPEMSDVHVDTP